MTGSALSGVRVLDLTTSYAGPTAGMYLADLGAHVVKVERPGGDDARAWGPPFRGGVSAWFASANRGKRSIVLDLKNPAGREALDALLSVADVLLVNVTPAKLAGLGLDPDTVRAQHPRVVYCVISGFGIDGPDAAAPGYDLVAQARSGVMSVTGAAGGPPQRVSTALTDIVAGMNAALGISAALVRQQREGVGELVEVSLLESAIALMAPRIASFLAGEPEPAPSGATDSVLAVYQSFRAADRDIAVAVGNDRLWQRLCELIGRADLAGDPRLADNAGRRLHRAEIVAAVQEQLRHRTAAEWKDALDAIGVPCAVVQSLSEVVADPQVVARDTIFPLRGSDDLFGIRSPARVGSGDVDSRVPALGAHTDAVLADAGIDHETRVRWEAAGAFGPAKAKE